MNLAVLSLVLALSPCGGSPKPCNPDTVYVKAVNPWKRVHTVRKPIYRPVVRETIRIERPVERIVRAEPKKPRCWGKIVGGAILAGAVVAIASDDDQVVRFGRPSGCSPHHPKGWHRGWLDHR